MNDFERKLSQQPFRQPPADLREAIFGALPQIITSACWTWRDWLWPSPQAWAALAALWLIFAAVQFADRPPANSSAFAAQSALENDTATTFLTIHNTRDFRHVLDLTN